MREIKSHKVNGLNDAIRIFATDAPGAGAANHEYQMILVGSVSRESGDEDKSQAISFQNGPIAESRVNGVSNEALLAIVIDRLQCFQAGDFKCRENAIALTKLEEAVHWLHHRTRERVSRGVEGTSSK